LRDMLRRFRSIEGHDAALRRACAAGMGVFDRYLERCSTAHHNATVLDPGPGVMYYRAQARLGVETLSEHAVVAELRRVVDEYRTRLGLQEGLSSESVGSGAGAAQVVAPRRANDLFGVRAEAAAAGATRAVVDEVSQWVDEPGMDEGCCPIVWWQHNSPRYPILSVIALDHFSCPSTSAPSERAFSQARQLVTDFRQSLAPETVRASMMLQSWMGATMQQLRERGAQEMAEVRRDAREAAAAEAAAAARAAAAAAAVAAGGAPAEAAAAAEAAAEAAAAEAAAEAALFEVEVGDVQVEQEFTDAPRPMGLGERATITYPADDAPLVELLPLLEEDGFVEIDESLGALPLPCLVFD
jgi:regulator of protease activity HflC (stomatin/prohibitin superfamily)